MSAEDRKKLAEIVEIEKEAFGNGAMSIWAVAPFALCGNVYLIMENSTEESIGHAIFLLSDDGVSDFFFSFSLRRKFRGKGLGKKLFKETLVRHVSKHPEFSAVTLTVNPVEKKNLFIFTSCGFKITDYFPEFYGPGEDRILMTASRRDILRENNSL